MFADSRSEYEALPAGAKAARKEAGNIIPMVFVTTADGETSIRGITYDDLSRDIREADRELRKHLETIDVIGSSDASDEGNSDASTSAFLSEARAWTNTEGKEIVAAVKTVDDSTVVFVINGNEVPYPLANLSEESVEALNLLINR
ncbi:MAG: hypothetical protein AAGA96_00915 [Verrucomicrobiota bacterium]